MIHFLDKCEHIPNNKITITNNHVLDQYKRGGVLVSYVAILKHPLKDINPMAKIVKFFIGETSSLLKYFLLFSDPNTLMARNIMIPKSIDTAMKFIHSFYSLLSFCQQKNEALAWVA
ncbi:MAG: hypothetical protein WC364_14635 [Eubacteriales bacterium]|jgi:hypothetical protein